jgi:hypothetical protein
LTIANSATALLKPVFKNFFCLSKSFRENADSKQSNTVVSAVNCSEPVLKIAGIIHRNHYFDPVPHYDLKTAFKKRINTNPFLLVDD